MKKKNSIRLSIATGVLCLCINSQIIAQGHAVHEFHDPIQVEGHYSEGRDRGNGAADRDIGGKDKTPTKETPTTTVKIGAGKTTVSQKAVYQAIALLQEYYGVDFFSSLFSPSMLPNGAGQTILIDRLKELAGEAALDNRKADADFFNNLSTQIINKTNIQYKFDKPISDNSVSINLSEPLILHNVTVRTTFGNFPGMQITIPGYMANAQGKQAELLVRFYAPNGTPLLANNFESFYRDVKGLVVVGSGALPVMNNLSNTSSKTFYIPYYALNLEPTNGNRTYKLNARAFMYINNIETAISADTPMLIKY